MARIVISTIAAIALTTGAAAGNSSSNSSSNSSGGVRTRVDTLVTTDDRGRRISERRIYRSNDSFGPRNSRSRRVRDDDD